MTEAVKQLISTTRALMEYMDQEFVFDKMGDAGCGGVDPYRSETFDELIRAVQAALKEVDGASCE
ncbi:hypothetical protein SAMN02746041_02069 [Desulfacinum hydrothermale DSM 13146]|uniref:Uncharacterized protein n=1 Tax=Desulfacinum hydrothermale DSM 13146 TaxID=1121390 RepID=A0A1W1XLD5_9BACT|nr:hypothetical protein [Desulfacinum hydrothermale]SMC24634.1 hypothetical protein SAMN02746041_02069 [Desulfacinum hydrothermale DSM 13146]